MTGAYPLIQDYRPDESLLWQAGGALSQSRFLGACKALARQLPGGRYALNLCEDRGLFLHAFAAAASRGQTNLLPPGRAPGVVKDVAAMFADAYLICDAPFADVGVPQFVLRLDDLPAPSWPGAVPQIPGTHAAGIVFTSGSTGGPQPHVKSWRNLVLTAGLCAERFLGADGAAPAGQRPRMNIVATVPPQHMYGLELSVMLALAGGCATHGSRPLFPEDVRAVLASVPEPRLLVTTPVHLGSLVASRLSFPPVDLIISATAPLPTLLAEQAETAFSTRVHEIYGCTEAGSMCTRRTLDGERWRPYPGLRMLHHEGMTHVTGPHLDAPVATPDVVDTHADGSITLLGRAGDMVKVAGKRASLTQLTGKLLAIPGVEDGVVFLPSVDGADARPAAVVVAPGLSEQQILGALAQQVDAVFLPRPLRRVDKLPRDALGKLPRAELLALLELHRA